MTDRNTRTARPAVVADHQAASDLMRDLVDPADVALIWTNPLGGQTFLAHSSDGSTRYLKIAPLSLPPSHHPVREAELARWIGDVLPVPQVVDAGCDEQVSWMLSDALDDPELRDWYAAKDTQHGWTRSVLAHQITTVVRYALAGTGQPVAVSRYDLSIDTLEALPDEKTLVSAFRSELDASDRP